MKILLVGPDEHYGMPNSYKRAFKTMGYDVAHYDDQARYHIESVLQNGLTNRLFWRLFARPVQSGLLEAVEREDPFVVWGSGEQLRTFTYVRDLAGGMVTAKADVKGGGVINLSDTKSVSIGQLAETVLDVTGHDTQVAFDESKPEGVKIRKPDMRKAEAEMHWEPSTPLRDEIRATYEWYVEQRG